ncbi:MAG: hypothetical protein MUC39_02020 [Candidatus Omnitrophica bacterium]|jgi:hypothetical protein|nr:hypothetical protein [Candidatus Omnitrophota bacterium]
MIKFKTNLKLKIALIVSLLILTSMIYAGILSAQEDYNTKNRQSGNVSSETTKKQVSSKDTETDNLKADGVIKTEKGLCLNGECKTNWPKLKCAEYNNLPAGESGDNFCSSMDKTCFAVFIGSGASYFSECSTPPASPHKTRCCWVE